MAAAKLGALVRSRWGEAAGGVVPRPFQGGMVMSNQERCWIYLDPPAHENFGAAMAVGLNAERGLPSRDTQAFELHVISEGGMARALEMASLFSVPPFVWSVRGRELEPGEPGGSKDAGGKWEAIAISEETEEVITQAISETGAVVCHRDGTLVAEVLGLEVARVVQDGNDTPPYLAIGVGKHDRSARQELHGGPPPMSALFEVVKTIARHRRANVASHPANQLCLERWLRAVVVEHPEMVGERSLRPVEHPLLPVRLGERCPALAMAEGPVLYAFSVGVDVEAPIRAALAAKEVDSKAQLVFVLPEGDDVPVLKESVARLRGPVELRQLKRSWRELSPAVAMGAPR